MPNLKFKALHTIQFPNGTEKVPLRIEGRSQVNATGERVMQDRVKIKEAFAGDVMVIDTDSPLYRDIKDALIEVDGDEKVTFVIPGEETPVEETPVENTDAPAKVRKARAPKGTKAASADQGDTGESDLV